MSNNKIIIILLVLIGILFYFKNSPFLRFLLIPLVKKDEAGYVYQDKKNDLEQMNDYLEKTLDYVVENGFNLTIKEKNQIRYIFANNEGLNTELSKKIKSYMKDNLPNTNVPYFLDAMNNFFIQKIDRPNPPKIYYRRYYNQKYDLLIELLLTVTSFDRILHLSSFYIDGLNSSSIRYRLVDLNIPRNLVEAHKIKDMLLYLPKYFKAVSIFGEEKVSQALAAQYALAIFLQNHKENKELETYQMNVLNELPQYLFDYPKPGKDALKSFLPAVFIARNVKNSKFRNIMKHRSNDVYKKELEKAIKDELILSKVNYILHKQINIKKSILSEDDELNHLFQKIDNIFNKYPPKLSLGLTDNQIFAIEKEIVPYRLPKDFIAFYKWHNGLQIDYITVLEPIKNILYKYYLNISMKDEVIWKEEYLPIHSFGSSGDEFIKLRDVVESPIYDYDYSEYSPMKYKSIKEMLKLFLETLEKKIIYYNEKNGKWEGNHEELEKFMSNKNL